MSTNEPLLYLARSIEVDHFWVVIEVHGALVETQWRVEREGAGDVLIHADYAAQTSRVLELGGFVSPEAAATALRAVI